MFTTREIRWNTPLVSVQPYTSPLYEDEDHTDWNTPLVDVETEYNTALYNNKDLVDSPLYQTDNPNN